MQKFQRRFPKTYKGLQYAGTAINIANKAYRVATAIATIVNSEKKYYDTTLATAPDTTAQVFHLSAIGQGDSNQQRHGNSVAIKSIEARLHCKKDSTQSGEIVRAILFEDTDNSNSTAPTASQLLEYPTNIMSPRNMDFPKRFRILKDKTFWNNPATGALYAPLKFFHKFPTTKDAKGLKIRNHHMTWVDGTGGGTGRNHLYLLVLGNVATASTASTLGGYTRIRFYDN